MNKLISGLSVGFIWGITVGLTLQAEVPFTNILIAFIICLIWTIYTKIDYAKCVENEQ